MTTYAPYTMTAAAARAKAKVGKSNQVGMCAHEVIVNIFAIPSPWDWDGKQAWAYNYWLGAVAHGKVVKTADPLKIPAGAMVLFGPRPGATTTGGRAGHIAVGAGGGYIYSTDLPVSGTWGKVKATEVTRLWGKALLGYILVTGDGHTLTDPPVDPPAPPPAYVTVPVVYQNVAGYNEPGAPGVTGFKTHIPNIAAEVIDSGADLFAVTELSNRLIDKMRPLMDSKLSGHLSRAPGGTDGRYVYTGSAVTVVAAGNFVAKSSTWFNNDDKQAAWVVFEKDGARGALMTYQLAYQDGTTADGKRVAQALNFLDQFSSLLLEYAVKIDNAVIVGDTNSEGMVAAAMKVAGWSAVGATDLSPTFNGWGHASTRIDWVFKHTGATAGSYKVHASTDSDHNRITFTFRLTK